MPKKFLLRRMKRMFGVMLFTLMSSSVHAADDYTIRGKTVEGIELLCTILSKTDNTCMVDWVYSNETNETVTIPSSVEGYSVVVLGDDSFRSQYWLKSVTIPNSVSGIGKNAFEGCTGLTSITIPNSVTHIMENAFSGCIGLSSVLIPNSVKYIFGNVFSGCSSIKKISVEEGNTNYDSRSNCNAIINKESNALISGCMNTIVPNSILSIGSGAFENCTGLTSITLSDGLTKIGDNAFCGCTGLTSIALSNSLTTIEDNAFRGCTGLTSIEIHSSVNSIGNFVFSGCSSIKNISVEEGNTKYDSRNNCNAIINKESNTLISGCMNTIIPFGVTTILEGAFEGCVGLTDISLPYTVTYLGDNAFSGCSGLTSIILPNSITRIGDGGFRNCTSLTNIEIPNSVRNIGWGAFEDCTSLNTVTLPNAISWIGNDVFRNCTSLTNIEIPNSVSHIGYSAFYDCTSLSSIILPKSVTEIEDFAFRGCLNLTSVAMPNTVKSIGSCAFHLCKKLEKIVLSDSITTIAYSLFAGCESLAEINIPPTITSIGSDAFSGCKSLTEITIPFQVESIGGGAFNNCVNLKVVNSRIKNPFESNAFWGLLNDGKSDVTLRVPYGTKSLYEKTDGWKLFPKIVEMENLKENDIFVEKTKEGIELTFQVLDPDFQQCRVGDGSHTAIINPSTQHVTIPKTADYYKVISVAENAFSGQSSLIDISFPETVTTLSSEMFRDCSSLAAIQWNADAPLPSSAMEGITNPNLLLYVKDKDYAPSGNWNVVANGVAGDIVLSEAAEGNNFYCPKEFTANSIEYTHNYSMTSGYHICQGWETIALPFDVTNVSYETYVEMTPITNWKKESHQRPFWLYEQTNEGWQTATTIKANTPYIICMPNNPENYESTYNINGNVVFKAANAKVLASDNISNVKYDERHFVPNFLNQAADNRIYAMNVTNQWFNSSDELPGSKFVANLRNVHPFEAYMMVDGASAPAFVPVFGDDIHTGIPALNSQEEQLTSTLYDLSGRKVSELSYGKLPKGLYIKNKRKVIVK